MEPMEQLRAVRSRFEEIGCLVQDPAVIADSRRYRDLMKEYKKLTPIAEAYDAYSAAESAFREAKELLESGGADAELRELAQAEYEENREKLEKLSGEIKLLLLPHVRRSARLGL